MTLFVVAVVSRVMYREERWKQTQHIGVIGPNALTISIASEAAAVVLWVLASKKWCAYFGEVHETSTVWWRQRR
jgi:hypothetical protein